LTEWLNNHPHEVEPAVTFRTRKMRNSDSAFLYSSFLRSYRQSDYTAGIPNDVFFDVFKQEFAAVLNLFNVLVAHPEEDEDEIAGFIAWTGRTVAWLYVKKTPWRRMGLGRQLLTEAGFLPGEEFNALFGSPWALRRARSHGYKVTLCPHVEAVRLLLGAK
jgi:GNAT superfamily N-acetyltransferase